jgi:GTP-binding protein HflX
MRLPGFDKAILSDTVGFVSDLPTELIAAFRATLEEVASADVLVHVRDMSHPDRDAQLEDVDDVLKSLGIGEGEGPTRIEAWNKVDLLAEAERQALLTEAQRRNDVIPISALTGWGVDDLRQHIAETLRQGTHIHQIRLNSGDGSRLAWLHSRGEVLDQRMDGEEIEVDVRLSPDNWARFQSLESA